MMTRRRITADEAALIEREHNLSPGSFAYDRPATEAEDVYLDQVEVCPLLAFLADGAAGKPALYVVNREQGVSVEDFVEKNMNLLRIARARGYDPGTLESFALTVTNWGPEPDLSLASSISIHPASIRGIFSNAPRRILLWPTFVDIPPTEFEERSPGRCIRSLQVRTVFRADDLSLQSTWYLNHTRASQLDQLLKKEEAT